VNQLGLQALAQNCQDIFSNSHCLESENLLTVEQ